MPVWRLWSSFWHPPGCFSWWACQVILSCGEPRHVRSPRHARHAQQGSRNSRHGLTVVILSTATVVRLPCALIERHSPAIDLFTHPPPPPSHAPQGDPSGVHVSHPPSPLPLLARPRPPPPAASPLHGCCNRLYHVIHAIQLSDSPASSLDAPAPRCFEEGIPRPGCGSISASPVSRCKQSSAGSFDALAFIASSFFP